LVGGYVLLFRLLHRLSGSRLGAYAATLFAAAIGAPFLDIRPQLYALPAVALLLDALLVSRRNRRWLPILFLCWVNLHASFMLGLLILTIVLVVEVAWREAWRTKVFLWTACVASCFVNPAGVHALLFPLRYAFDSNSPFRDLNEWRSPWMAGGTQCPLYVPAIIAFAASTAIVFSRPTARTNWQLRTTTLMLGLLTLSMSVVSRRFVLHFGLQQALMLSLAGSELLSAAAIAVSRRYPITIPGARFGLPAAALGLCALWLRPYPLSNKAFLFLSEEDSFPIEAMNMAEANHLGGRTFNYYNWGGYVDYRTDGKVQVFIDGRADTVFDDETYRQYEGVLGLRPGWQDVVDSSGAELVLWPATRASQTNELVRSGRWKTWYRDHVATILVRSHGEQRDVSLDSPESPWRELRLGWTASDVRDWAQAERHFVTALDMMPNLRTACEELVRAKVMGGHRADATSTLERCEADFPDRERYSKMLASLDGLQ
jgi:hypothetical protein